MKSFFKSIYLSNRIYFALLFNIVLFVVSHFFPLLYPFAKYLLFIISALVFVDFLLLYTSSKLQLIAKRQTPERLSNGDINEIKISLKNHYSFKISVEIIDEIPFQFQKRDFGINLSFQPGADSIIEYKLRPVKRGVYVFGKLNIFVTTVISFVKKRFVFDEGQDVAVYPSFIQMRKYELLAISNNLQDVGIKKIRRISNNSEFEQIKEYVSGDDFRTVNWKATARRSKIMVNQYQDEKSQQVYSIIDMGRTMKMPFNELSLLDYAINATLAISNIAMKKHDKAGFVTFSKGVHSIVPASKKNSQMSTIMEVLYKQQTNFLESNHEMLYIAVKRKIRQRSLLLYYTNFEGLSSLKRQIQFLIRLAKSHLVVVIFFENTELKKITDETPLSTEDIYIKTIAEKFSYEKRLIVKELKKHAIHSVLTAPENLTVNTINKYLELKARGLI